MCLFRVQSSCLQFYYHKIIVLTWHSILDLFWGSVSFIPRKLVCDCRHFRLSLKQSLNLQVCFMQNIVVFFCPTKLQFNMFVLVWHFLKWNLCVTFFYSDKKKKWTPHREESKVSFFLTVWLSKLLTSSDGFKKKKKGRREDSRCTLTFIVFGRVSDNTRGVAGWCDCMISVTQQPLWLQIFEKCEKNKETYLFIQRLHHFLFVFFNIWKVFLQV